MTVTCTFDEFCSVIDEKITYPTKMIKICCLWFAWNYYNQCEEEYNLEQIIENEQKNIKRTIQKVKELYGID